MPGASGAAPKMMHTYIVMVRYLFTGFAVFLVATVITAQPQFSDAVRGFIKVDAPVIALTNVRVIDGTTVKPPAAATVLDLSGRSVIPGLVMVHEHLYYPAGPGVYGQLGESFIRLYLAGGVTTMRTGGNVNFDPARLVESVKGKAGLW